MCCLFGLLDYKGVFSAVEKNFIVSILSRACEVRGIDATGIAYNINRRLQIFKRPLPGHKMHYRIPNSARYIMGHTRMKTQGSEKHNYNNHPFSGYAESCKFALCHNGILHNDTQLRKSEALPNTIIQTDSYIAVQLLEKQKALNFESLKRMAEKVKGSFTFTILDSQDNLYVVKESNPFALYHFKNRGFYLYASTDEILTNALKILGIQDWQKENIPLSCGDILKIDRRGKIKRSQFDAFKVRGKCGNEKTAVQKIFFEQLQSAAEDSYLQSLKIVTSYYGYSPDEIEELSAEGFSVEEIEEFLYATPCEQDEDYKIFD